MGTPSPLPSASYRHKRRACVDTTTAGLRLLCFLCFFVTGTARAPRAYGRRYGAFLSVRVPRVGGEAKVIIKICFAHPLSHGINRLHMALPLPRHRTTCPPGLNLRMYNIRYGWSFRLLQAVRAVQIEKYDLMLLVETHISDEA